MNILLVDDSGMMRTVLRRALEQTGLEITEIHEATDGKEGYEAALARRPDLVLTDINMPHVDGLQMLKMLKSREETSKIPVLVLSTESGETLKKEVLNNGGAGYLLKPFTGEQLLEALCEAGFVATKDLQR